MATNNVLDLSINQQGPVAMELEGSRDVSSATVTVSSESEQPPQFKIPDNVMLADQTLPKSVQADASNPMCNTNTCVVESLPDRARVSRSTSRSEKRSKSAVPYGRRSGSRSSSRGRVGLPSAINSNIVGGNTKSKQTDADPCCDTSKQPVIDIGPAETPQ